MKNSKLVDRDSRRNALKGMAVLGGAAAISASTSVSAADIQPEKEKSDAPKTLGYHQTEHIREYYRLARF
ncbi:MAG: twin-arginine translocation signal domain-containing protein [Acidiferrobacterales bacterium]|nr:twin-arginine translocation signal domain-containing protein [Acidiferrobacterales bacterium]